MPERSTGLDAQTRALVHVAVAVASGDTVALRQRLGAASTARVPARWIDELLLQSLLNVGYALGLQAFGVWREVSPAPAAGSAEAGEATRSSGCGPTGRSEGRESAARCTAARITSCS